MSASIVTGTVTDVDFTGNMFVVTGFLTVAAGDYAAGGLVVDITAFAYGPGKSVPAMGVPLLVHLESQPLVASKATALFVYSWLRGSTLKNGQMQIFTGAAAQSGLAELSTGATPAGVVADHIRFVIFAKRITS